MCQQKLQQIRSVTPGKGHVILQSKFLFDKPLKVRQAPRMQHPWRLFNKRGFIWDTWNVFFFLEKAEFWVKVSTLTTLYNYCRWLTGFANWLFMGMLSRPQHRASKESPEEGIILVYILAQRCPQPVPHNYSKCDSVVGFGISEMQTAFSLPLSLSHPPSCSIFCTLFLCASLLPSAVSQHAERGS